MKNEIAMFLLSLGGYLPKRKKYNYSGQQVGYSVAYHWMDVDWKKAARDLWKNDIDMTLIELMGISNDPHQWRDGKFDWKEHLKSIEPIVDEMMAWLRAYNRKVEVVFANANGIFMEHFSFEDGKYLCDWWIKRYGTGGVYALPVSEPWTSKRSPHVKDTMYKICEYFYSTFPKEQCIFNGDAKDSHVADKAAIHEGHLEHYKDVGKRSWVDTDHGICLQETHSDGSRGTKIKDNEALHSAEVNLNAGKSWNWYDFSRSWRSDFCKKLGDLKKRIIS